MAELSVVEAGFLPWSLVWLAPLAASLVMGLLWLAGVNNKLVYPALSILGILSASVVAGLAAFKILAGGSPIHAGANLEWIPWLDITLGTYIDGLSAVLSLVVTWVSLLIAVYSVKYMEGDPGWARYFFMITFFVGSMSLLVTADNLILMFIGWEGTGIASYALIGHWYTDEEEYWVGKPGRYVLGTPMFFEPSHSAVRAILFTRVGDVGLLLGITILYLAAGSFSIPEIAAGAGQWASLLAGEGVLALTMLILLLGAFAKSAQFPFHEWLVTAMTGPTPVSALIHAATMVKAGVYLMLRLTPILVAAALAAGGAALQQASLVFEVVAWLGVVTALALSLMAIVSDELKLILAYSTGSQLGYMMLAAAAGGMAALAGDALLAGEGVAAGLGHLVSHAVFKASLFLAAGWLIHALHTRFIDPMGRLARYMKLTAVSFWLAGLSLAGIPPLSGFFTKEAVIEVANLASPALASLAALTAVFTALYTARLIIRVFHAEPYEPSKGEPHEAPPLMLVPYLLLSLASLVLGLYFSGLFEALAKATETTLSLAHAAMLTVKIAPMTLAVVGGAAASFLVVGFLYLIAKVDFRRLIKENAAVAALHGFLYDRMYINPVIYLVIVGGFAYIAVALYTLDSALDAIYHVGFPALGILGAAALRRLHRGRTDYIVALYSMGAAAVLLAAFYLLGG